ncbi:MAG: serine hydrolase [Patescibacteria group bacterium]
MLANFFISLIAIPLLWTAQFNFDGFLNLGQSQNFAIDQQKAPQRIYTDYLDVKTTAESIVAVDVKSGKILYQKNSDEIRPIASITKLMTALVFLDHNPGWTKETFTIPSDLRYGSTPHLKDGEIITVKDLFYTALVASDNTAIIALTRIAGFNEDQFVQKMNEKAKSLGLAETQFADPSGLDPNNQSSAKDVAKLLNYALQNEELKKVTTTEAYEFQAMTKVKSRTVKLYNTDRLVHSYLDIVGGKTGSLNEAGYCLAVKIKGASEQEILIVVLGSKTDGDRFQDVKAVYDWVFSNYKW